MTASLDELLARRVDKAGEVAVSAGDVMRWSEAHRVRALRHWPDATADWVAPPAMVTSFVRPLEWRPDRVGPPRDRGSTLHEELKAVLGFPLGIAGGYELELHGLLRDGDRLVAVERIASVGEPEPTRLGPGRRWVIENEIRRAGPPSGGAGSRGGDLVAVERFLMLGYDPATVPADGGADARPRDGRAAHPEGQDAPGRVERLDVDTVTIVMGASANRVWTPAHIDRDAAAAAGIADLFLDTSTQVGLLSVVAGRAAHPDARPGRLALRMRRPVLRGDHLVVEARAGEPSTDAAGISWVEVEGRGVVAGEVRSSLTARFAVPGAEVVDPWAVDPGRWRP